MTQQNGGPLVELAAFSNFKWKRCFICSFPCECLAKGNVDMIKRIEHGKLELLEWQLLAHKRGETVELYLQNSIKERDFQGTIFKTVVH